MSKRLTGAHPLAKKLLALESYMEELGISIEFTSYNTTITDTESGISAVYRDADSSEEVTEIPYGYESKLIIEE